MDTARATVAEGTELAGPNSVSNVGTQVASAMTYLMDAARATFKQFTSDHAYAGGLQVENQAAMSQEQYQQAHLNDKLEQTNAVSRAPSLNPIGTTSTNAPRVGFGDPNTVRVRNDCLVNEWTGLANKTSQGMERWIPRTTVSTNQATAEAWVDSRNSPYLLAQLQNNPFALPSFATVGNMSLPPEVSGLAQGNAIVYGQACQNQ